MGLNAGLAHAFIAVVQHPVFLVGVGSGCGGILRYYLGRLIDRWTGGPFPWGTFAVNATGSFVLGVLALWVLLRLPGAYRWVYLLFGTGFCGGFTTFSTFSYETYRLLCDGYWWGSLANVLGSVAAGLLGVLLAAGLVRLCSGGV